MIYLRCDHDASSTRRNRFASSSTAIRPFPPGFICAVSGAVSSFFTLSVSSLLFDFFTLSVVSCQFSVFSCHRCCSTHSRRCRRIHQESNQRGRIIDKSKTLDLGCLFYSSCIETVRYETTTHGRPLELRCRCWAVSASLCLSSLRRT